MNNYDAISIGSADIATLAGNVMTKIAVTGATFDIDGAQQLVDV